MKRNRYKKYLVQLFRNCTTSQHKVAEYVGYKGMGVRHGTVKEVVTGSDICTVELQLPRGVAPSIDAFLELCTRDHPYLRTLLSSDYRIVGWSAM